MKNLGKGNLSFWIRNSCFTIILHSSSCHVKFAIFLSFLKLLQDSLKKLVNELAFCNCTVVWVYEDSSYLLSVTGSKEVPSCGMWFLVGLLQFTDISDELFHPTDQGSRFLLKASKFIDLTGSIVCHNTASFRPRIVRNSNSFYVCCAVWNDGVCNMWHVPYIWPLICSGEKLIVRLWIYCMKFGMVLQ